MEQTSVKIMQCKFAKRGQLTVDCIGVGVGVVLYDRVKKVGVGLHVLAPRSAVSTPPNPAKYADSGVLYAVEMLAKEGGLANPVVAIAGGAAMEGSLSGASMGIKVVEAVKEMLSKEKLSIAKEDTGGSRIRSILLDIDTGQINFR
ncbi:MAG: chemotaxis protein CheD [Deltaproteobacteria bacterium]|nr:chemotaxis protein CheD [Deltaproteobacteria bacterium]